MLDSDPEAAEDVVQEALVRAWRRWHTCQSEEARVPWLLTITRREALRWAGRRTPIPVDWIAYADVEQLHRADHQADPLVQLVAEPTAVAGLRESDRRLLRLRYEEDLTQKEIAQRLELPEGTIAVRLHRLRVRLRSEMTQRSLD